MWPPTSELTRHLLNTSMRRCAPVFKKGRAAARQAPFFGRGGSEESAKIHGFLLLLLKNPVHRAEQSRLAWAGDGLSVEGLRKELGCHGTSRSRLWRGFAGCRRRTLRRLAEALLQPESPIFGAQLLERLRRQRHSTGIDLVALEELGKLGCHGLLNKCAVPGWARRPGRIA